MIQEIHVCFSCWQLSCMQLCCKTNAIASCMPFWSRSKGGWEEGSDGRYFPLVSTGQAANTAQFMLILFIWVFGPMLNPPLEEKLESNRLGMFSCFKFQPLLAKMNVLWQWLPFPLLTPVVDTTLHTRQNVKSDFKSAHSSAEVVGDEQRD